MAKPQSPFTGIKLSEPAATPAPSPGPDQRLFSSPPPPRPQSKQTPPVARPVKEASKQGTLEPRNQASAEQTAAHEGEPRPLFDIMTPAYQNNTYAFTEEELWAIEDTKQELERKHNIKVTKYNLIRLGIHFLIEDFRSNRAASFTVKRLRTKNT